MPILVVHLNILARSLTRIVVVSTSSGRCAHFMIVISVVFSSFTLGHLLEPKLGFAGIQCILSYPMNTVPNKNGVPDHEAVLEWNGKIQGENTSHDPKVFEVFAHDCIGVAIKKGKVTVQWLDKNKLLQEKSFSAITTLTESIFQDAQSGPSLERFHQFLVKASAGLCGQCSEKVPGGARGSGEEIAQVLHHALSGVLVVGPDGLKWPLRKSKLQNIATFKIYTGDFAHREVDGVTHDSAMIRIAPGALVAGRSYVWEAGIQEAGKQQMYSGRFEVAEEERANATLAQLAEVRNATNGQLNFEQEAAFYFQQTLHGNATIALIQWFNAKSQDK